MPGQIAKTQNYCETKYDHQVRKNTQADIPLEFDIGKIFAIDNFEPHKVCCGPHWCKKKRLWYDQGLFSRLSDILTRQNDAAGLHNFIALLVVDKINTILQSHGIQVKVHSGAHWHTHQGLSQHIGQHQPAIGYRAPDGDLTCCGVGIKAEDCFVQLVHA